MQKVRVVQNSFQFGEVSDSLIMRTDSPVYGASAQRVENMIVTAEGSLKKRYGLKHIYDYSLTYDSAHPAQSHLFKFEFDENEKYVISVENQKVRCFQLETSGAVTLVSTITTDTNGGALPFDQDYLQEYTYAQYGDVMFICHPLFAPRMLIRTSLTSFEITPYTFDQRADNKVTYQPYSKFQSTDVFFDPSATTGTGITVEVYAKGTADDDGIATEQTYSSGSTPSNLTLDGVFASGGTVTLPVARKVTITSDTTNTVTFTITGTNENGIAAQDTSITSVSAGTTVTSTFKFKTITAITASTYYTNIKVGVSEEEYIEYFDVTGTRTGGEFPDSSHKNVVLRYGESEMEIASVQSPSEATVDIVDSLRRRLTVLNPLRTIDGSSTVEVTMLDHGFAGGESITIEDASAVGGINTGSLNGARTVGSIIDENTFTFTAGGSASSAEDGGGYVKIVSHAPTLDWDEQSWSAKRGYPAAIAFHENRLCFAGTLAEPDTVWMSKIGSFFNFDVGEAEDIDSINLVAATGDVNQIRYMVSNRDLQIFTASGELYVPTYLNQAITPTNAQIRKQTPYGSEFVQPASIDGATIFVQTGGRIVREYLYTDSEDAYTSTSISTIASHLINEPKCMAVVHSGFGLPDSYAAITLGNGDMTLFSSNRAEKRASWTRVTTDGSFCSVVAIHDRLFANIWYNNKLQLCEFDGTIGLDDYIADEVINAEGTIPTIQYGDFEGTTINVTYPFYPSGRWYVNTTSGANWEHYDKPSDSRIARIIKTSSDSLLGGQTMFYANDFQFKKGVTYTIEFTLYNAANAQGFGTTADVRLKIGSGPLYTGDWITDSDYGAGGITTFTESFTPTADGYYDIKFEAGHSTATSWAVGVDNVSVISAVNEPLDLTALSSGFAAGDVVSIFEGETYIGDETLDSNGKMSIAQVYGKTVSIGKKFTSKVITNPVDASLGSGPATGEVRGITNVVVDVKSTKSMKVNSRPVVSSEFTGKKEVRLLGYNRNPQVTIEQDEPTSMQVNGIVAELIV